MPGSENLGISKKTFVGSVEILLWARPVQLGATGCAAHLLGQLVEIRLWTRPVQSGATGCAARLLGHLVEILTLGRAVQLGVGCGRCRNSQHSKNCVSLSSRRKTKFKTLINVSYLNYEESPVFRY